MMEILFWAALTLILYTYIGFPLLVYLRGFMTDRTYYKGNITPSVSIIIAAYNEADAIGAKLENLLSLDYPAHQMEIIVASDGSQDETNEIVKRYAKQGVKLLPLPRQGKAAALNAAVILASSDILVFSDANSMFESQALRNLVQPFADANVGGVAGNQRYLADVGSGPAGEGEKSYWRFDRRLKEAQSRAGNVISATGAIYAIRKKLFISVPEGVTDDFVTSTRVIAQGRRLVFAADAVAYEPVADKGDREFDRKVRVITRGLWAVVFMRQLLNPMRYGFYALQLFSHKLLRRLVVFPLIGLLIANIFLWPQSLFYQLALLAQAGFYALALVGLLLADTKWANSKLLSLPYYFCLVNGACLVASMNVLRGHRIVRWNTVRRELEGTAVVPQSIEQTKGGTIS